MIAGLIVGFIFGCVLTIILMALLAEASD